MFIELCTTCSSLHVCNRGCLSCFWGLRFLDELRLFALINGYYECLEHAHHFVSASVNMAVSSCQVVLAPCVEYCYNSLKKILLLCYCVARDTHFSAFIIQFVSGCFFVSSCFVLVPCVRYGYNSLNHCLFVMKSLC